MNSFSKALVVFFTYVTTIFVPHATPPKTNIKTFSKAIVVSPTISPAWKLIGHSKNIVTPTPQITSKPEITTQPTAIPTVIYNPTSTPTSIPSPTSAPTYNYSVNSNIIDADLGPHCSEYPQAKGHVSIFLNKVEQNTQNSAITNFFVTVTGSVQNLKPDQDSVFYVQIENIGEQGLFMFKTDGSGNGSFNQNTWIEIRNPQISKFQEVRVHYNHSGPNPPTDPCGMPLITRL